MEKHVKRILLIVIPIAVAALIVGTVLLLPLLRNSEVVLSESHTTEYAGTLSYSQYEARGGASKVVIRLTDDNNAELDTYTTAIRDGDGLGTIQACNMEDDAAAVGLLLTGSEMQPRLVVAFNKKLYPVTVDDWVDVGGKVDDTGAPIGTWKEFTLSDGRTVSLPRGASAEQLCNNTAMVGQTAATLFKNKKYTLHEIPLCTDWIEVQSYWDIAYFTRFNAFEVRTASGRVLARFVADGMSINVDVQLAGETDWKTCSFGVDGSVQIW